MTKCAVLSLACTVCETSNKHNEIKKKLSELCNYCKKPFFRRLFFTVSIMLQRIIYLKYSCLYILMFGCVAVVKVNERMKATS